MENNNENISKMSFEDAFKEMEEVVKKLEKGGENLNEAIKLYERGSLLRKHCEERLDKAKMQIEKVMEDGKGKTTLEKFDFKDN